MPLTQLARPLDIRLGSNRFALLISFAAALLATFAHSPLAGLLYGLTVFLAWAFGRELDPDTTVVANLSALLTFVALFVVSPPSLLTLLYALLLIRVITRTAGDCPTSLDGAAILALAVWFGFNTHWLLTLALPLFFMSDVWLQQQKLKAKLKSKSDLDQPLYSLRIRFAHWLTILFLIMVLAIDAPRSLISVWPLLIAQLLASAAILWRSQSQ